MLTTGLLKNLQQAHFKLRERIPEAEIALVLQRNCRMSADIAPTHEHNFPI